MKTSTNFPLENADEEIQEFIKSAPGMLGDYDFSPSMLRYTAGPYEGRFVEPAVQCAWMMYQVRAKRAQEEQAEVAHSQDLLVKTLDDLVNGEGAALRPRLVDVVAQFARGDLVAFKVPRTASVPAQEGLAPESLELINKFAAALASKMLAAQRKYGYGTSWEDKGWKGKCADDLHSHLGKGDPRDVAIYCAFMWHHGWSTTLCVEQTLSRMQRLTEFVCAFLQASKDGQISTETMGGLQAEAELLTGRPLPEVYQQ